MEAPMHGELPAEYDPQNELEYMDRQAEFVERDRKKSEWRANASASHFPELYQFDEDGNYIPPAAS